MTCSPSYALYHSHNGEWKSLNHSPQPMVPRSFLIIDIEYLTKWVEVEPIVKIKAQQVIEFISNNIITRFGIPTASLWPWRLVWLWPISKILDGIQSQVCLFSLVCHSQSNGQLKKQTSKFWMHWRKSLTIWKDYGLRKYHEYYGRIGQWKKNQLAKSHAGWHLE